MEMLMNQTSVNWEGEEKRKDYASLALLIQTAVKEAVAESVQQHPLTADEIHWVRMAIEAEANKAAFRKAVIEKTFIGLISAATLGAGAWLVEYFMRHWK
jgi:hypothetical protein